MDIGEPQRIHIIEPAVSPVPKEQPRREPIPRHEPAETPTPERAPEKVPAGRSWR